MIWLEHAIVILLVVVAPIWDYFEFKRLRTTTDPDAKVRFYRKTLVLQWVVSAAVFVAVGRGIFLAPPGWVWMHFTVAKAIASVFAAGLIFAMVAPFAALKKPKARIALRQAFSKLMFFLPNRAEQYGIFAALCVTAGICEEWVCRGFLFRYFGAWPSVGGVVAHGTAWQYGLTAAFVISTIIFGANHFYQGVSGVIQTTVLGAVFGLIYLWTGSLLIPMIVHALVDLRALLLLMGVNGHDDESHNAVADTI